MASAMPAEDSIPLVSMGPDNTAGSPSPSPPTGLRAPTATAIVIPDGRRRRRVVVSTGAKAKDECGAGDCIYSVVLLLLQMLFTAMIVLVAIRIVKPELIAGALGPVEPVRTTVADSPRLTMPRIIALFYTSPTFRNEMIKVINQKRRESGGGGITDSPVDRDDVLKAGLAPELWRTGLIHVCSQVLRMHVAKKKVRSGLDDKELWSMCEQFAPNLPLASTGLTVVDSPPEPSVTDAPTATTDEPSAADSPPEPSVTDAPTATTDEPSAADSSPEPSAMDASYTTDEPSADTAITDPSAVTDPSAATVVIEEPDRPEVREKRAVGAIFGNMLRFGQFSARAAAVTSARMGAQAVTAAARSLVSRAQALAQRTNQWWSSVDKVALRKGLKKAAVHTGWGATGAAAAYGVGEGIKAAMDDGSVDLETVYEGLVHNLTQSLSEMEAKMRKDEDMQDDFRNTLNVLMIEEKKRMLDDLERIANAAYEEALKMPEEEQQKDRSARYLGLHTVDYSDEYEADPDAFSDDEGDGDDRDEADTDNDEGDGTEPMDVDEDEPAANVTEHPDQQTFDGYPIPLTSSGGRAHQTPSAWMLCFMALFPLIVNSIWSA